MTPRNVTLFVLDTLADWAPGYANAGIDDPAWQAMPGRCRVRTAAVARGLVATAGSVRIPPDITPAELQPVDVVSHRRARGRVPVVQDGRSEVLRGADDGPGLKSAAGKCRPGPGATSPAAGDAPPDAAVPVATRVGVAGVSGPRHDQ